MGRNLRGITGEAKEAIRKLLAKDAIPAVAWIDMDLNPHLSRSGVWIAFYTDRNEIEDHIQEIDGFEIVNTIPVDLEDKFDGKILDYDGRRFVFRDFPQTSH
jgi:hypothetical protein